MAEVWDRCDEVGELGAGRWRLCAVIKIKIVPFYFNFCHQ